MSGLRIGRVVDVHPEDNSVDLVMTDDGSRYIAVQVLAIGASGNTGLVDLPTPAGKSNKWSLSERTDRDVLAVTSMLRGGDEPVVLGFLFPQVNGVLFAEANRYIHRHASDVYTTITGAADLEMAHPSGSFIRMAANPDHEDLTGRDFDGKWAIENNTGTAPYLCVTVKSAGAQKAKLVIAPNGDVTLTHTGKLVVNTSGTAEVTASGAAKVTAPSVTLDTPATTCTGNLTVQGNAAFAGGSVTHGGVNIGKTHTHGGVDTGSGTSGPPS